ncbi:S8 family serine peptidase, partial [Streptomyces sp. SB3404]|nr:S8 family serine peptidase [Streptomyces boncukensis]
MTLGVVGAWVVGLGGLAPTASAQGIQSQQWYLKAMRAQEMHEVSTGKGIKVAVIDTGVDPSTPSLRGQVLPGKDVSGAPGDETEDDNGHGTSMAELIAGTGRKGSLRGLAPDAKIIPITSTLSGVKGDSAISRTDRAIRAAADSDAQIISMSFGSPGSDSRERAAVKYAARKGKLLFASAGNDAKKGNFPLYPASLDDVAGIGALDSAGKVAEYSTYGPHVALTAPGLGVPGWCDGAKVRYCVQGQGGTSSATAL